MKILLPDRHFAFGGRLRCRAFTLIELLVVITIIAVLVSILMPALASARRSGRRVVCQSNLRELGRAAHLYADAFDGFLPLGETDPSDGGMHYSSALLPALGYGPMSGGSQGFSRTGNQSPYTGLLGTVRSFQCPDFPNDRQTLDYVVNAYVSPYPHNDDGGQPGDDPDDAGVPSGEGNVIFQKLTRLKRAASGFIYLTEGNKNLPTDNVNLHDLFFANQLPFGSGPRISNDLRHPGGINVLFFDTHVEIMRHQTMDVGWPHPVSERLRWFSTGKKESD